MKHLFAFPLLSMLPLKVWLLSRFLLNETPFLKPTHPTDLPRKRLSYSVESSVCVLAPACPFQILYLLTRPWGHSLVDHLLIIASTLSKETNGDQISFPPLADRAHLA